MEEHTIAYSKSHRKTHIDARGKVNGEANTLSTGDGCTSQSSGNYVFTKVDKDMTDIKFVGGVNPKKTWNKDDKRSLSRNYSQGESPSGECILSPCLSANMGGTANGSQLIVEEEDMKIVGEKRTDEGIRTFKNGVCGTIRTKDAGGDKIVIETGDKDMQIPVKYNRKDKVKHEVEEAGTLSSSDYRGLNRNQDQTAIVEAESEIRIRKLTPTECCRLQGYPDNWLDKGINDKGEVVDISNTQKYKMAGNGISSTVPQTLFPAVFGNEPIRVMSLFSGCGGTELLLPENFEVVGHCEFDKYASSVLRYHYPNIPNFHDVTEFADRDDVPEFDLLVGGFPCQSWSIAGLRKGFDDERGQLIYNVYDIIRKHKPKYICLENVKGLLSKDKGDAFEAIMEYISGLGYELDFEVVNSKYFGLAQNRERVFIFGKLK